ncbi:hypothetical protein J4734_04100 [Klebsiella pneumoniae]|uniref:Uncharacterized protein n=1 Tax=Klebsiella pneumoniae TaxID=573 RepID=A0A939NPN9_KLEPN|nr:hypothetical protein [Klebsiella pneumoniae]
MYFIEYALFSVAVGHNAFPIEKQWDKILASARRQILAQVSAFPALMGIKKHEA